MLRLNKLSVSLVALLTAFSIAAGAAETPPGPGEAIIPPSAASSTATPAHVAQSQAPAQPASPPAAAAPQAQPQATNQAPATAPAAAAPGPAAQKFSQEQLDQLLAPIALYPDQLLGQILMASTYPLEVVEAARWAAEPAAHRLAGNARFEAMKAKGWDPSVMALVPFERVLSVMSTRLDWLRDLGTAFVSQQAEVMASVQRLRHLAMAAGNLKQTAQCRCTIADQGGQITIAAIDTGPVCVPAYNTRVAYGRWPHPSYPPMFFPQPPGLVYVPGYAIGFYPVIDLAWWYAPLWGWDRIDWAAGHIVVDSGRYGALTARNPAFAGGVWVHDAARAGAIGALGVAGVAIAARGAAAAFGNRAGVPAAAARAGTAGAGAFAARGAGRGFAARSAGAFRGPGPRGFAARGFASRGFAHGGGHFAGRFGGMGGGHFAARSVGHFGGFGGGGGHFGGGGFHGGGGGGGFHGGGGGGHHR